MMEKAEYSHSPLLGGLEVLNATFEKQHFARHTHEGYTIGLIRRGAQRFWRSGARHIAPSNSVILVNADQVHDGHAAGDNGWSYDAIYPTVEQIHKVVGQRLAPHFPMAVSQNRQLAQQLARLFDALKQPEALLQETILLATMTSLSQHFSRRRHSLQDVTLHAAGIERARKVIDDDPAQQLSLHTLANIAGLSPYHFSRQFKKITGLPAHAYQIQRRVQRAKILLAQGHRYLDVALMAGFHDQSHLHRHFCKTMGTTPHAYQKAMSQCSRKLICV